MNGEQELSILDNKVTIGRRKECEICLNDPLVSGSHCEITNGFALDNGSTNGTQLNGQPLKAGQKRMLKAGDKLQIGDRILRIESGTPRGSEEGGQDLSRSKKFIGGLAPDKKDPDGNKAGGEKDGEKKSEEDLAKEDEDAKLTVEELMDKEFAKIIGHDSLKKQLRQFYKKVQLDQIRQKAGKEKDVKRLYHMIFSGPPGTGKTTMANLVSKIMLKMKLVSSDKVVFVNNSLELLGSYVGQTPAKVDAKVMEAKGGIVFIDEAYRSVHATTCSAFRCCFRHLITTSRMLLLLVCSLSGHQYRQGRWRSRQRRRSIRSRGDRHDHEAHGQAHGGMHFVSMR